MDAKVSLLMSKNIQFSRKLLESSYCFLSNSEATNIRYVKNHFVTKNENSLFSSVIAIITSAYNNLYYLIDYICSIITILALLSLLIGCIFFLICFLIPMFKKKKRSREKMKVLGQDLKKEFPP